jgi:hypothetical protein
MKAVVCRVIERGIVYIKLKVPVALQKLLLQASLNHRVLLLRHWLTSDKQTAKCSKWNSSKLKDTKNNGISVALFIPQLAEWKVTTTQYPCVILNTLISVPQTVVRVNSVYFCIFGPKREEDGSWRKLLHDELHGLYSSPNIFRVIKSRRMRWAGHVVRMGGRGVYRVLFGRPEGKRPLGRLRRRWRITLRWTLGR